MIRRNLLVLLVLLLVALFCCRYCSVPAPRVQPLLHPDNNIIGRQEIDSTAQQDLDAILALIDAKVHGATLDSIGLDSTESQIKRTLHIRQDLTGSASPVLAGDRLAAKRVSWTLRPLFYHPLGSDPQARPYAICLTASLSEHAMNSADLITQRVARKLGVRVGPSARRHGRWLTVRRDAEDIVITLSAEPLDDHSRATDTTDTFDFTK